MAIGREHDRSMFVAAADDLKEVAGGFVGEREVAELVDDQQLWAVPEGHGVGPASFDGGLGGASDQLGGGGVVDAVAGFDRAVTKDRGQQRLANARRVGV